MCSLMQGKWQDGSACCSFIPLSLSICCRRAVYEKQQRGVGQATKHSLCVHRALRQNEMVLYRHGLGSSTQTNKTNVLETAGEEDENEHH